MALPRHIRAACSRNGSSPKTRVCVTQFRELETYTRNLEADLAARLDGAARELKECQDELAQAQSMQARATAESLEVQRERDELRQELIRRTQEAHQMHRDLKHSRADVVVKDAFISDLRQQLLVIGPLVSQRDQLCDGDTSDCRQSASSW